MSSLVSAINFSNLHWQPTRLSLTCSIFLVRFGTYAAHTFAPQRTLQTAVGAPQCAVACYGLDCGGSWATKLLLYCRLLEVRHIHTNARPGGIRLVSKQPVGLCVALATMLTLKSATSVAPFRAGAVRPVRVNSRPCILPSFHNVLSGVSVGCRAEGMTWECTAASLSRITQKLNAAHWLADAGVQLVAPTAGMKWTMMRHGNKVKHLGRPQDQRKALIRSLVTQVIQHGQIRTTKVDAIQMLELSPAFGFQHRRHLCRVSAVFLKTAVL